MCNFGEQKKQELSISNYIEEYANSMFAYTDVMGKCRKKRSLVQTSKPTNLFDRYKSTKQKRRVLKPLYKQRVNEKNEFIEKLYFNSHNVVDFRNFKCSKP